MGERGNIVLIYPPKEEGGEGRRVYFYTHWRGHMLHDILREAMNHKELWPPGFGNLSGTVRESCRWYDASYFARVIFCRLVAGEEGSVLSFGIDVDRTLPDHNELHVDFVKNEIREIELEGGWDENPVVEKTMKTWTFQEFADRKDIKED